MRTLLEQGRMAFDREAWSEAYSELKGADSLAPLAPEDLDRLATAAFLVGDDLESVNARTRAHHGFLERGETAKAARSACLLAFTILDRPDQRAQAGGWFARARRLIEDGQCECAEQGLLLYALGLQKAVENNVEAAYAAFQQAAAVGARFGDRDVTTLARHGEGRALIRLNRAAEGLVLLDEVMVAITRGEAGPLVTGVVYCSVIGVCHELFDWRRAQEWTAALAAWCAAHPDIVPFRGACLIHRSQVMQLHGAWAPALEEAKRACERLSHPPGQPNAGSAYYQLAELHRLRGEFDRADEAFRLAHQGGRPPYPGLALLRLAQGQVDAAHAAIQHAMHEIRDRRVRARVLSACVDIAIAHGDRPLATAAAEELERLAGEIEAPFLRALGSQAVGTVALASNDVMTALDRLQDASAMWHELDAPYELACVRTLIGLAYRQLNDHDGAQLEFDAAQDTFDRLGATPDAARVAALSGLASPPFSAAGGLTGREVEVLRLVATGATNREIASRLAISEKTVARHLSNIFTKLDLPSRSAATAYAYEHKLV